MNGQDQDAKERLEVVDGKFLCLYFIMFIFIKTSSYSSFSAESCSGFLPM